MIGLGVVRIVLGDLFGGMWTLLLGWFLVQSASAARHDLGGRGPNVAGPAVTPAAA